MTDPQHPAKLAARVLSVYDVDVCPGWAEVTFDLFDGTTAVIHEKLPVIGIDGPTAKTADLGCEIIRISDSGSATIKLAYSMEDAAGRNEFTVPRTNLTMVDVGAIKKR